jgi:glycosyltransferase 2 family protein
MKISPTQRRLLHWIGSFFALLGIFFVGFRLHSYSLKIDFSRITPLIFALITALSFIYGAANFLLARAWWNLLQHFCLPIAHMQSIKIFGISQLAKYVPGNIFHFAGRQALGMAAGLAPGALAKSTVLELGLLAIAGAQFGWLLLPLIKPYPSESTSLFILLGSVALTAAVLQRIFSRKIVYSFFWQIFFMFVSGTVFIALLALISDNAKMTSWSWLTIGGTYVIAWLAGLVTPGAPAGVGVREFMLLLMLNGMVSEVDLLMAVLLGRFVTVVGDFSFFAFSHAIPDKIFRREKINAA